MPVAVSGNLQFNLGHVLTKHVSHTGNGVHIGTSEETIQGQEND